MHYQYSDRIVDGDVKKFRGLEEDASECMPSEWQDLTLDDHQRIQAEITRMATKINRTNPDSISRDEWRYLCDRFTQLQLASDCLNIVVDYLAPCINPGFGRLAGTACYLCEECSKGHQCKNVIYGVHYWIAAGDILADFSYADLACVVLLRRHCYRHPTVKPTEVSFLKLSTRCQELKEVRIKKKRKQMEVDESCHFYATIMFLPIPTPIVGEIKYDEEDLESEPDYTCTQCCGPDLCVCREKFHQRDVFHQALRGGHPCKTLITRMKDINEENRKKLLAAFESATLKQQEEVASRVFLERYIESIYSRQSVFFSTSRLFLFEIFSSLLAPADLALLGFCN